MNKTPMKETNSFFKIIQAFRFGEKLQINAFVLIAACILTCLAAVFDGISLGMLVPTIRGIIEGNFKFIETYPVIGAMNAAAADLFSNRRAVTFALLIGVVFITVILKNIFQYSASLCVASQGRRLENNLRKLIYSRYLSFGKLYFDQTNAGHLHQILTSYTQQIAGELSGFNAFIYQVASLVVYLLVMCTISWELTVFTCIAFPTLHYALRGLIDKIKASSHSYAISFGNLGKKISNSLACIPLVKAYARETEEAEEFSRISNLVEKMEFSIDKKRYLIWPAQEIMLITIALIVVGAAAYLMSVKGVGTVAGYMVFFVILKRSMGSFGAYNQFKALIAGIQGPIKEISSVLSDDGKYFIPEGKLEFKGLTKEVRFNHLNFSYPNRNLVIKNVSFSIRKGQMTALVGPSGAGKSTLMNLLMRFYDSPSGTVFLDDQDIRDFSLKSLHSKIAYIGQETLLFNATLRANLIYGLDKIPALEEVNKALVQARLEEFIQKLPNQLESEIGDRGIRLSGGERQRVAIARAILKKAEILLLDEATSALDSVTEKLIQEALDEIITGRTTLVIAHRLSTVQHADKIIVIENGSVVEQGTLHELLELKGKFLTYWQAQKFY